MKLGRSYVGVCVLLLLLWGLLMVGARDLSLSMDEPLHIAAGYTFLARGQASFWYFPLNLPPPLLNASEGLLLFLTQPHIPLETLDGWGKDFTAYTNAFLPYLAPMERTEVLARSPMMLMVLLLGALVFRWGKEVGGVHVGLLAIFLFTFDPTLLAHGRLANTDTGVTTVGLAALYTGWRWLEQPAWKWATATGVLLGLTMLAKFSGVLWTAAFGIMTLYTLLRPGRSGTSTRICQAVVITILALLTVWATFGFSLGLTPLAPFPLPAPTYWTAFNNQQDTAAGRIFIAFGKTWFGTQWWYFPLNFIVKNPLPLLAAFLVGSWAFIRLNRRRSQVMTLMVFPLVYVLASIVWGMNVSYRHLYPIHPFLYLAAAKGLCDWFARQRCRSWPCLAGGILGCWYVAGALRTFPNELTYFNELAGGAEGGHRYLVDYTQDWGQSFKQLRGFIDQHPGSTPQVIYFTAVHPGHYGIVFRPLLPSAGAQEGAAPFHPRPGRYVMGDAPLYGLVGADPQQFDWFRRTGPTAVVGHSLSVYDVVRSPAWIAQCGAPIAPLDSKAIARGFGYIEMRQAHFDCTTTWLYPANRGQLGVYALHHTLLSERDCLSLLRCDPRPDSPFIARHLSEARLSYEQRYDSALPAFVLYELDKYTLPRWLPVWGSPAGTSPGSLANLPSLTTPVPLDGPLVFLGTAIYQGKNELEVETWWQVTRGPINQPFSIMAHLLTAQGESLGLADGLGISPLELVAGDIVVQLHRFERPPRGQASWLRTGVYWLNTTTRWEISDSPGNDALFVPIGNEQ